MTTIATQGSASVTVKTLFGGRLIGIELGKVTTGELVDCIGVEGVLVEVSVDVTGLFVKF